MIFTLLQQADTARTQQGTPDSESSRESPSGTPSRTPSDADSPQGTPSEIDAESRAANVPPNTESLNEGRQSEEAGAPRFVLSVPYHIWQMFAPTPSVTFFQLSVCNLTI